MVNLRKRSWSWLWLTMVVIILDRLSKHWVDTHLSFAQSIKILPFFNLTLAYNTGSVYGFLNSQSGWQIWLFACLSLLVSIFIFVWLSRLPRSEKLLACSLSLILAGALGNLIDRLMHGYVIDFADFHIGHWHFATFNIADSAITIGACLLIIKIFFFSTKGEQSWG